MGSVDVDEVIRLGLAAHANKEKQAGAKSVSFADVAKGHN
jgi:hypothetical protein